MTELRAIIEAIQLAYSPQEAAKSIVVHDIAVEVLKRIEDIERRLDILEKQKMLHIDLIP